MLNINFVPEDYIQNNESHKTNLICLALLVVLMAGLGGSFATIKIRQRVFIAKENLVNTKMAKAQEDIEQFDDLQAKAKLMKKTALTAAELLEPVPRSLLLASLTNNLPAGTSLLKINFIQKKPKNAPSVRTQSKSAKTSKYENKKASASSKTAEPETSLEKLLETHIAIEGIAPSDLQVAAYIAQLSNSILLNNVALVESKEHKIKDTTFRHFKLTAMLKKDINLTNEDVNYIRNNGTLRGM